MFWGSCDAAKIQDTRCPNFGLQAVTKSWFPFSLCNVNQNSSLLVPRIVGYCYLRYCIGSHVLHLSSEMYVLSLETSIIQYNSVEHKRCGAGQEEIWLYRNDVCNDHLQLLVCFFDCSCHWHWSGKDVPITSSVRKNSRVLKSGL